jgi:hypothetical protein
VVGEILSYGEVRVYEESYKRIYISALWAMKDCGFKRIYGDFNTGKLGARTTMSLTSWGETIKIKIDETEDGVRLNIIADPDTWDIDNSRQDVEGFFYAFDERLSQVSEGDLKTLDKPVPMLSGIAEQKVGTQTNNVSLPPDGENIQTKRSTQNKKFGYIFLMLGLLLLLTLPLWVAIRGIPVNGFPAIIFGFVLMIMFLVIGLENLRVKEEE